MIWLRTICIIIGLVCVFPLAGTATAGSFQLASGDHDDARKARRSGAIMSMSRIIRIVRRLHRGRPIDAYLSAGKRNYYIIWKTDRGDILRITVDARTGEIIRVRRGRG